MSDGKLVRDLLPELMRRSGSDPVVRYLFGVDLRYALAAKLREEAIEASDAVDSRDDLVKELADLSEVIAKLMNVQGISEREVADAARAKATRRGQFETGAWVVSPVPAQIRRYTTADVEAQRRPWIPQRWTTAFTGHEAAHAALMADSEESDGITRNFLHSQAARDPVDLFLMCMPWGYSPKDYGPSRTSAILAQDGAADKIVAIVDATRRDGAAAGWGALLTTHKIKGLNMSFGTKLLYFAGYTTDHRPRPLILDARVRESLDRYAPGTVRTRLMVRYNVGVQARETFELKQVDEETFDE